jgi:hypothetical protein
MFSGLVWQTIIAVAAPMASLGCHMLRALTVWFCQSIFAKNS